MPSAPAPVDVATLPSFSNQAAVCSSCGARYGIRVHFDRGCVQVYGGDHFHRLCGRCGTEWVERGNAEPRGTSGS